MAHATDKAAMFSSSTDNWSTPDAFYGALHEEFGFEVDVCADDLNHKCPVYFTRETNGLMKIWHKIKLLCGRPAKVFYMNPPYGDAEQPCVKNCKKKKCLGRLAMRITNLPGVKKAYELLAQVPGLMAAYEAAFGESDHHNEFYVPGIADWMRKAYEESLQGCTVVCLVPARTDSCWFHDWVDGKADEVRLIKGRLFFGGAPDSAPFPNVLVVYRPPVPVVTRYSAMKQPPKSPRPPKAPKEKQVVQDPL